MAEALHVDSNRQSAVRIRHIPTQNEGDGGLFASLTVDSAANEDARVPRTAVLLI